MCKTLRSILQPYLSVIAKHFAKFWFFLLILFSKALVVICKHPCFAPVDLANIIDFSYILAVMREGPTFPRYNLVVPLGILLCKREACAKRSMRIASADGFFGNFKARIKLISFLSLVIHPIEQTF